ncbi:hypothetical protein ACOJBO_42790 [Rhizobium beringeri]
MLNRLRRVIRKVLRSVYRRLPSSTQARIRHLSRIQLRTETKSHLMLQEYGASWAPLPVFADRASLPTLTIVTDSVDPDSLFGGVGTALVVGAVAASRLNARLRLVTRTAAPDPAALGQIIKAHRLEFNGPADFAHMPLRTEKPLPLGPDDLILTTSWWSTRAVLGSVSPDRVIYLLQEDERMFYPYSDMRLRCAETLREAGVRVLVNTQLLFDHLAEGPDFLPRLRERGCSFEPAFPAFKRPDIIKPHADGKKNFFFYARPNHPRNLYWRGLEVIDKAVREGLLPVDKWNFHFAGHDIRGIELPGGVKPKVWPKMPWAQFADLISQMDLGLSLMDTPHPSYPPFDLAASGAVVITNTHGPKVSLDQWSRNIIAVPPSVPDLVDAIRRGVALAFDTETRFANCADDRIARDWESTLGPPLERLLSLRSR